MPTKERYARMTDYEKEMTALSRKSWYEMNKEYCRQKAREYYQENKERIKENARLLYQNDSVIREYTKIRGMKAYRKKHPEIKRVRIRKNGEQWPPKTCPYCKKEFIPSGQRPEQIFCSSLCYAKKRGYLNLPQYKNC